MTTRICQKNKNQYN